VIVDLYDAIDRMLWAIVAWIAIGAALATPVALLAAWAVTRAVKRAWRAARRSVGAGEPLCARLEPEQPESVPRDPEAAQRPSEALWALDPHDTGETPKPPVPV